MNTAEVAHGSGRAGFWLRTVGLLAAAFGLLTVKAGGDVLFGPDAARAAAGHFVPFVLWFNFLAGFVYVAAGGGLWLGHRWAVCLAAALAAGTAVVGAAFAGHVATGGPFEMRTVWALALRFTVWALIARFAWRILWAAHRAVPDRR